MVQLFAARFLLAAPDRGYEGGGVVVARGRIERVLTSRGAVRRQAAELGSTDLGDCTLTPGLVNAHAHLELSGLAGRLSGDGPFPDWIRALIAERAGEAPASLEAAARAGAARCLATGTTTVGDVDSTGASERALAVGALRVRLYREALDGGDPSRVPEALAALERPFPRSRTLLGGVSPHAPYTVSAPLWLELGRLARRRRLPVTVHWAETREECEWLTAGTGPFAALPLGPRPRGEAGADSGLDAIESAGLLGPRTSLVHANHARPSELERVARAGATVVHCPGTHAFFARGEPPLRAFLAAGCNVALGTDSLASNEDLDLLRELALLRRSATWLDPARAWAMATVNAARAVGLAGRVGELVPGAHADLLALEHAKDAGTTPTLEGALEALTMGLCRPVRVIVAGAAVQLPGSS